MLFQHRMDFDFVYNKFQLKNPEIGYKHFTFNHKENFVDTETGKSIQLVVGF
jgi:hypothetical protein